MQTKILEALAQLDQNNANHWTVEGLPKLETVRLFAADQTISRQQIAEIAPAFTKDTSANFKVDVISNGALDVKADADADADTANVVTDDEFAEKTQELAELKAKRDEIDSEIAVLNKWFDNHNYPDEPLEETLTQYFAALASQVGG